MPAKVYFDENTVRNILSNLGDPIRIDDIANYCWDQKLSFSDSVILYRKAFNLTLFDAQKALLSDVRWKRFIQKRLGSNTAYRKEAFAHLANNGPNSLVHRVGDTLKIR